MLVMPHQATLFQFFFSSFCEFVDTIRKWFLARLFFKTEEVLSPPARRRRRLRRLRLRPVKF